MDPSIFLDEAYRQRLVALLLGDTPESLSLARYLEDLAGQVESDARQKDIIDIGARVVSLAAQRRANAVEGWPRGAPSGTMS